jgi:hypothetical protein
MIFEIVPTLLSFLAVFSLISGSGIMNGTAVFDTTSQTFKVSLAKSSGQ